MRPGFVHPLADQACCFDKASQAHVIVMFDWLRSMQRLLKLRRARVHVCVAASALQVVDSNGRLLCKGTYLGWQCQALLQMLLPA